MKHAEGREFGGFAAQADILRYGSFEGTIVLKVHPPS